MLPAVESARDDRYKLTQDEANASLILHEATVLGAVKENSKNLFSANPALSQAASTAVAQTYYEYMRTYDAVDPITGKPLYSQSDKAKAQVYMRDKIMTEAAIGWFESQPDPAKAYLEMASDDFKFNINLPGEEPGKIIYENQGKTRNRKVNQQVESWLTTAAGMLGPNVSVHVTSGGQPTQAEIASARARGQQVGGRTGSTRHDHGNAADIVLSVNGKKVTPQQNPQLYRDFAENAAAAGATGIGHYSWGIHVGGGSETVWGPDTRVASVDPAFAASVARGRTRRGSTKLMEPMNINMPLKSAMSEKAWNSLDQEMRQRINFTNQQYDRQIKQQEAETKEAQEAAGTSIALRIYAAGQKDADGNDILPIDPQEIDQMRFDGLISNSQAQSFIKAITTEKPERSDPNVYQELQRRMWNGEDVQDDLLNAELLSQSDRNALLQKNRDLRQSEGRMTAEESRQYAALGDLLKTPGMFGEIDQGQAVRAYEAQQEFIDRINARAQTGETLTDIVRDIRGRYFLDMSSYTGTQLDRIGLPRFAVTRDTDSRMIDIAATTKRIADAFEAKKFSSEQEFYDQLKLVAEWDRLQKQLDEQQRQAENNGKGRKK